METEEITALVATIVQLFLGTLFSKFEWFIVTNKDFKAKCELIKEKIVQNITDRLVEILRNQFGNSLVPDELVNEDKVARYSINLLKGAKFYFMLDRSLTVYKIFTASLMTLSLSGIAFAILVLIPKFIPPMLILIISIAAIVIQGLLIVLMHFKFNELDEVDEKIYG